MNTNKSMIRTRPSVHEWLIYCQLLASRSTSRLSIFLLRWRYSNVKYFSVKAGSGASPHYHVSISLFLFWKVKEGHSFKQNTKQGKRVSGKGIFSKEDIVLN